MSPTGSSFSKRSRNPSSGGNYSPRLMRTDASLLTTGMKDYEVFNQDIVEPKSLTKHGGKLSNDYGQIPFLREQLKRGRGSKKTGNMRKYAKSIITNRPKQIL